MNTFTYNPKIVGKIIKDDDEQFDKFFYQGHPLFLIPDFNQYPDDIWLSYIDFLERDMSCEIYDQDGGEVTTHIVIDKNTGLTRCVYTAYGIMIDKSDEPQDIEVKIEGYVVEVPPNTWINEGDIEEYIFVSTKVFEAYKASI